MRQPDQNKGKILIVDDTPTNLDLLFKYLTRSGFEVLVSQSGEEALGLAAEAEPDIILLDIMMPDMDGFETCAQLKKQETTRDIPVIFMTALVDVDNKVKAFTMGAVDYVAKPFERREVLARLTTHLTLRRLQKNLELEIAERKKVEEQLRQFTEELQVRNAELDAFGHTVAHNLQNPLNAITGISELLVMDSATISRDRLKKYLDIVHRSGQKAANIIQELMILASVRQREVVPTPLDMEVIVLEAQQRVLTMVEEYDAQIHIPDNWPAAVGYGPWVEEVWANYLSNAIKYGGTPPVIEVGGTPESNGQVRFWVKDNGPGLNDEEQSRLFTPFTQLSQLKVKGHGLGLSIVRRIVHKLGGEVGVSSSGRSNEGSTFSFTLPAAPAPDS